MKTIDQKAEEKQRNIHLLLLCGVFSAVLYIAMNIITPLLYPGYNVASQTISELSAIDAPTRSLWVVLGSIYGILIVFFGRGIYKAAGSNKKLRIAGLLIMLSGVVGLFWPPMHQRQVLAAGGGTLTDTLHIVFTFLIVPLFLASNLLAGLSLGKRFLAFSILTIALQLFFGVLTGLDAPALESNWPTPYMGIFERVGIAANVIWQVVLAITLFNRGNREPVAEAQRKTERSFVNYTQGAE